MQSLELALPKSETGVTSAVGKHDNQIKTVKDVVSKLSKGAVSEEGNAETDQPILRTSTGGNAVGETPSPSAPLRSDQGESSLSNKSVMNMFGLRSTNRGGRQASPVEKTTPSKSQRKGEPDTAVIPDCSDADMAAPSSPGNRSVASSAATFFDVLQGDASGEEIVKRWKNFVPKIRRSSTWLMDVQ